MTARVTGIGSVGFVWTPSFDSYSTDDQGHIYEYSHVPDQGTIS
jgi:hypothetical protein